MRVVRRQKVRQKLTSTFISPTSCPPSPSSQNHHHKEWVGDLRPPLLLIRTADSGRLRQGSYHHSDQRDFLLWSRFHFCLVSLCVTVVTFFILNWDSMWNQQKKCSLKSGDLLLYIKCSKFETGYTAAKKLLWVQWIPQIASKVFKTSYFEISSVTSPYFVLLIVSRCYFQTLHCITAGSDWCPFSLLLVSNFSSLHLYIFAFL